MIARYIPEVAASSVISPNMLADADAANTLLLAFVGLLSSDPTLTTRRGASPARTYLPDRRWHADLA
jgi:hypothetical protein